MAVWTVECRVVLPEMEAVWLNTFRNDYETKIELAFALNRVRIGPCLDFCSDGLSLLEGKIVAGTKAAKHYRALHSGEESSDQQNERNGDHNREQGWPVGENVTSQDERHLDRSLFGGVLGSSFGSESVLYILKISIREEPTSVWNLCCRRASGVVNDDDELTIMGGGVIEWYKSGQQHPLTDMEKLSPTRGQNGSRHHILLVFGTQEDQIAVSLMFLGFKYRTRGYLESALSRMNPPTFIRETLMVAAGIYSPPYCLSPLAKFACYLTLEQVEDYECSICLDSGNAFYSRFPSCSHLFHPVCLLKWFSHNQTKSPSMAISHQIPRLSHTTIQSHVVATRIERRRAGRFRLSPIKRFHGQQVVVQCPICRLTQTF